MKGGGNVKMSNNSYNFAYITTINAIAVSVLILLIMLFASQSAMIWSTVVALIYLSGSTYKFTQLQSAKAQEKYHWYEEILDNIPNPLSVTDLDMNWTFINRAVEGLMKVKRDDILGHQCNEWGAPICKTDKCGVVCLRGGNSESDFEQWGKNFGVETQFLYNKRGEKIGHVEYVTDVTAMDNLNKVTGKVTRSTHFITQSISQITKASQNLASATTETASSVEEMASSLDEINTKTKENAENSMSAKNLSTETKNFANLGVQGMAEMNDTMKKIDESSQSIAKIIKIIDGISFQTNLLALNAAVEAARAGAHGKGFAVVAEEVRNLAGRSSKAASEISQMIEQSLGIFSNGIAIGEKMSKNFEDITNCINKMDEVIEEISNSSNTQAESIAQINMASKQIGEVTQQNTAISEETSAAAQDLAEKIRELSKETQLLSATSQSNKKTEKKVGDVVVVDKRAA